MLPREALSTVADDWQVSFETVLPLFVSHSSGESVVRAVLLFRLVVDCLLVKKTGLVVGVAMNRIDQSWLESQGWLWPG